MKYVQKHSLTLDTISNLIVSPNKYLYVKPERLTKHTTIIFSIAQADRLRRQRNRKVGTLYHIVDTHLHTNPSTEISTNIFHFC